MCAPYPYQVSTAASWHHLSAIVFYVSELERDSWAFQESKHKNQRDVLQLAKQYKQKGE